MKCRARTRVQLRRDCGLASGKNFAGIADLPAVVNRQPSRNARACQWRRRGTWARGPGGRGATERGRPRPGRAASGTVGEHGHAGPAAGVRQRAGDHAPAGRPVAPSGNARAPSGNASTRARRPGCDRARATTPRPTASKRGLVRLWQQRPLQSSPRSTTCAAGPYRWCAAQRTCSTAGSDQGAQARARTSDKGTAEIRSANLTPTTEMDTMLSRTTGPCKGCLPWNATRDTRNAWGVTQTR